MSPRTLKWLHRIGYVCTALILAESMFIAYMLGASWSERRHYVAAVKEDTRTRNGPLQEDVRAGFFSVFENFESLPALNSMGRDGIRFRGHAALGLFGYALAIDGSKSGEIVHGVLKSVSKFPEDKPATVTLKEFFMPRTAYVQLVATIDKIADGFSGGTDMCNDGLSIAFERVRSSGVISGQGNGACSDHYKKISAAMLKVARQYAGLDVGEHWMPRNPDAPR